MSGEISHLVVGLAQMHRAVAASLLRRLGLYAGQELLLMRLWESGHRSQGELAKAMRLDPSTVTRMVRSLEQQGLLTRNPSATDRRVMVVSLTGAGRDLRGQVDQAWAELEAITTDGMSDRQQAEAVRLLRRMERNLAAAARPGD